MHGVFLAIRGAHIVLEEKDKKNPPDIVWHDLTKYSQLREEEWENKEEQTRKGPGFETNFLKYVCY